MGFLCVALVVLGIVIFPFWAMIQILELRRLEETLEKRIDSLQKRLEKATSQGGLSFPQEIDAKPSPAVSPDVGMKGETPRGVRQQSESKKFSHAPSIEHQIPNEEEVELSIEESEEFPAEEIKRVRDKEDWKVTLGRMFSSLNENDSSTAVARQKKPPMSFERRMVWGAVWVGAIALVMAGVYFVKEAIESGWLGPAVRISMAAGAGLITLGIGEYLRKTQKQIAHGITAAGVSLLYAALIGATTLHHLIPDALGMICMIGITALAVGLSLRHGPFVALLGLLGGFIMPKLLASDTSSALQLFSYLILLQIGLIAVTRYRGWYWLMFGTFLGGVAWSLLWILFVYRPSDAHFVASFLMISTLAFLFGVPDALKNMTEDWEKRPFNVYLPWCAVLTAMGLFVLLIGKTNFPTTEWCYFGVLGAGCIILARIQPRYFPAPGLACLLSGILLWSWRMQGLEERSAEFLWICTGLGTIYGVGAYAALWKSERPEFWGWLSAAGGLLFLFIARYSVPVSQNGDWQTWDWVFLAVAGAYAGGAIPLLHRREHPPFGETLAALVIAATGSVAFAIQYALESRNIRWIWVGWCWSLLLPVIALLMCRLKLKRLADFLLVAMYASGGLLLINPQMFLLDYGDHPFFNRLWLLFGIPLGCMVISRMIVGRFSEGDWLTDQYRGWLIRGFELLSVFFACVLTSLLIRHGFNPEFRLTATMRLIEWGMYVNAWLGLAILLKMIAGKERSQLLSGASLVIGWVAISLMFLITPALWFSILFEASPNLDWGYPVLLLSFWAPIVLVFILKELYVANEFEVVQQRSLEVAGWCLGVMALGASIRRGFHITPSPIMASWWEIATYPLVWGFLAITVLGIGLHYRRQFTQMIGSWLLLAAGGAYVISIFIAWNPLWTHIDVGSLPIANGILYAFGGMILVGVLSMRLLSRCGNPPAVFAAVIVNLITLFLLITLEVRQWFRGAYLDGAVSTNAERYCYSAAWILLGICLLVWGIISKGKTARYASLTIMVVSVLKVFVVDMQHLEDLWRVVSFLGLGISLLMLVAVYQKFVFGDANTLEEIERLDREDPGEEPETEKELSL